MATETISGPDRIDGIEVAPLLPADACPKADARALLDWWERLPRRGSTLPDWRDADPLELLPWMGWISLYDVVDGGRDIRYRLVGSRITEWAGIDLTGKLVSGGVYVTTPRVLLEHFQRLGRRAAPTWTNRVVETQNGVVVTHDRIWLPFRNAADGIGLWLLYLCRLESYADRAAPVQRGSRADLAPVALNPVSALRN